MIDLNDMATGGMTMENVKEICVHTREECDTLCTIMCRNGYFVTARLNKSDSTSEMGGWVVSYCEALQRCHENNVEREVDEIKFSYESKKGKICGDCAYYFK